MTLFDCVNNHPFLAFFAVLVICGSLTRIIRGWPPGDVYYWKDKR